MRTKPSEANERKNSELARKEDAELLTAAFSITVVWLDDDMLAFFEETVNFRQGAELGAKKLHFFGQISAAWCT